MDEPFSSHSLFRACAHAAHGEQLEATSKLVQTRNIARRRKALQELETDLLAHLRAEEELILPDFALVHAAEAARIRAQHDQIRRLVMRLVGAPNEELLGGVTLKQLGPLLRDCSAFEERVLYPWAEQQLRASKKGEFVQRAQRRPLAVSAPLNEHV